MSTLLPSTSPHTSGHLSFPTLSSVVGVLEHVRRSIVGSVFSPRDRLHHEKKTPLYVLVPGFSGTSATMEELGEILAERINVAYAPTFPLWNTGSLGNAGKLLAEKLQNLLEKDGLSRDITLIGFSNGGIIALHALSRLTSVKVREVITLATPFSGTPLATPISLVSPACRELSGGSHLPVVDISSQIQRGITAHISHLDSIVPPGSQSPPERLAPKKVRRVHHRDFGHTDFVIGGKVRTFATSLFPKK